MEERTTPPIDSEFCASDADVTFESIDGVQFRLHRKNLETHTGAFPAPEFETNGEITPLTEPAKVLHILFQFVYPRRQPDLECLDFEVVAAVSEAAEKYEVFSAMPICNVRMRQFIADYAADVLAYAVKHDYPNLIDQIAPTLVTKPLSLVLEKLPIDCVASWVKYHEAHGAVFEAVLESIRHKSIRSDTPFPSLLCTTCYFRAFCEVQRIKHLTNVKDMLVAVNDKEVTSDGLPCDCRFIRLNSVLVIRLMLKKELERLPKFLR